MKDTPHVFVPPIPVITIGPLVETWLEPLIVLVLKATPEL